MTSTAVQAALCFTAIFSLSAAVGSAQATGARKPARPVAAPARPAASPARGEVPGGAWAMPDPGDLVERVIRRIVSQDRPAAVPIAEFRQRAFGHDATLTAVRKYLGRDVRLPPSVYASVAEWTDAVDKLPEPECISADSACARPSSVWLAVTKFERGDLPHELNVWYTTAFVVKPHNETISSRYSFCERWLRIGGTWKYDGFIRVTSG